LYYRTSPLSWSFEDGSGGKIAEFVSGTLSTAFDTDTLYVDGTNDRVGINTSSPSYHLTVASPSGNASAQIMAASGAYPQLFFGDGGTNQWHIESTPSGGALYFVETGVGYPLTLLPGNKVGIGDTTPSYNLDVNGTGRFTSHLTLNGDLTGTSNTNFYVKNDSGEEILFQESSNSLFFKTNGSWRAYFTSGGDLIPYTGSSYDLGSSGNRWAQVWANTAVINTSSVQSGYELTVNGDTYQSGACRAAIHDVGGNNSRDKLRVWNSGTYAIGMSSGYTYGYLNDYAMSFQMSNSTSRGWWWGDTGHSNAQGAMSLTTDGRLCVATRISVGQGESVTSPNSSYNFYNNGTSWLNGTVSVPGVYNLTTAATTPYIHLSTSTYAYKMYRSTSTLASKRNIEDMEDFYADLMLQSRPVWYQSAIETDDPDWSWLGLVAEEQAALDPHLANWQVREDWDGDEFDHMSQYPQEALEVSGVPYERLSVPLLLLCQRQQNEINDLEARVAALEAA